MQTLADVLMEKIIRNIQIYSENKVVFVT